MRLRRHIFVFIYLVGIASASALALDGSKPLRHYLGSKPLRNYLYEVWEEREGLPHYGINSIAQGLEGYLWLATYYGLVRFDGKKFAVFDRNNTPRLATNRILCLASDPGGGLWLGTESGLISFRNNVFQRVSLPGAAGISVRTVEVMADGEIWIGTAGRGAFVIRNGQVKALGPPGQQVFAVLKDSRGAVWLGTRAGLFRYRGGRFQRFGKENGLPDDRVLSLLKDKFGVLLVGTAEGLAKIVNTVIPAFRIDHRFDRQGIWTLKEDRHGSLWIGTHGGGLARLAGNEIEFFDNPRKISSKAITAIYEDREGSLWFGASGAGLGRLREAPFRTLTTEDGLGGNLVQAVKAAQDGTVWVGFNGGGLGHLAPSGRVLANFSRASGLTSDDIRTLLEDRRGGIWAGSFDGTVTYFSRGLPKRVFTRRDGLPGDPILSLMEDRNGSLWAGTMNGGLAVLKDGQARLYRATDGLTGKNIRVLHQDVRGRVWIGTDQGLIILEDGRFRNFGMNDGLSGKFITAIHEEPDGTVWIGTFDGGLTRFRNGRFAPCGSGARFPATTVFQVLDDGRSRLWVSSSTGIYRFDKRELNDYADGRIHQIHWNVYGIADGLKSRECNRGQPAGDRTRDGRLWFPTMKGLAVVEPGSLFTNPVPPAVIVEGLRADGKDYPVGSSLELPAGSRNLEIQYTGLSLVAPEKVAFRYRLLPFDQDWVEAGDRRTALYSNLPPGSYRFLVSAANNDGVWNNTGAAMEVVLLPRFYQTWTFWGLCLATAFGLAWSLHHARTRRLTRLNQELEQRVAERTHRLEQANREMGALIEDLSVARIQAEAASRARSEFVANVSHEIRTPMSGILGLVGLALETPLTLQQREYLRLTEESAQALLQVLNDVLDFSKIDAGHLSIEAARFHLRGMVRDSMGILAPRAAFKHLRLACEFDPALPEMVVGDAGRLRQVLLNLVGNAIKFTPAGSVCVLVGIESQDEKQLVLWFSVRDTGIGIAKEKQSLIFQPFQQADNSTTRQFGGTGLGLAISARLVAAMKGHIWLESAEGQGTTFHFTTVVDRAVPAPAPPDKLEHSPHQLLPLMVLLAEDNRINQRVAVSLLQKKGCAVDVVENGADAIARTADRVYDLVLMDVQMPVMDGLAATSAIREREKESGRHLPIVALTAHAMAGDEDRCLQAGMDAYLTKPINSKQLTEVLERIFQHS